MNKKEFAEKIIKESLEKRIAEIDKHGYRLFMPQIDSVCLGFTNLQFAYIKPFLKDRTLIFKIMGYVIEFHEVDHPSNSRTWEAVVKHETYSNDNWIKFDDLLDENPLFKKQVLSKEIRTF